MGQLEISEGRSSQTDIEFLEQWRRRWNVERGGPPIGSMHEVILEHGADGHEFITDFIAYAISTCIVENANGTCHFRVLKYLHNVNEIHNYIWCAYFIKCLNDAILRCTCKNCKKTNSNREDLASCPRQLQIESNNVHIVHIAMDNFKTLCLLLMIQCR
ncbi:hypothetical protein Cgig2_024228 [Carnegiea gigantea]|uniref:Uncharacterized protein n=1 Tax=Carnegiea gigantea TaxID=171969 RepID=A0A9Q1K097_9CARY|nr:hypothetical protein Cgig2_024228 [Carnegiea gigantea]